MVRSSSFFFKTILRYRRRFFKSSSTFVLRGEAKRKAIEMTEKNVKKMAEEKKWTVKEIIQGIVNDLTRFVEENSWIGIEELRDGLRKELDRGFYNHWILRGLEKGERETLRSILIDAKEHYEFEEGFATTLTNLKAVIKRFGFD